jgi:cellulose synthase/poly-beta-1,6-N-acetylglucosamine synthase-like glycosyltransferase
MRYEDMRKKSVDMISVVIPAYNEEGFIEKTRQN